MARAISEEGAGEVANNDLQSAPAGAQRIHRLRTPMEHGERVDLSDIADDIAPIDATTLRALLTNPPSRVDPTGLDADRCPHRRSARP